MYFVDLMMN